MGLLLGMRYERTKDEIWLFSSKNVVKLGIKNEDKDAWKLYMEKKKYKEAYEICKKYNSSYTNYVGGLWADELLESKKFDEAARLYVETSRNFEEISLKFLMGKSLEGFESNDFKFYLIDSEFSLFGKLAEEAQAWGQAPADPFANFVDWAEALQTEQDWKFNRSQVWWHFEVCSRGVRNYLMRFALFLFENRRVREADKDLSEFLSNNINDLDEVFSLFFAFFKIVNSRI